MIKKEELEIIEDKSKNEQIIENFIERSKSPLGRPTKRQSITNTETPKARRSQFEKFTFKSRGSTPVDEGKNRSKSPAFGKALK